MDNEIFLCIAQLVSLGIQLMLMYRYLRNAYDQKLNKYRRQTIFGLPLVILSEKM